MNGRVTCLTLTLTIGAVLVPAYGALLGADRVEKAENAKRTVTEFVRNWNGTQNRSL